MVQDLDFKFETYSPPPRKVNGVPFWEKVVPYNACYLPQGDARVDHKTLNPVDMWMEDRWVLLRRIYGSEFIQKLFMQCLTFIYGCNDIKGSYFHEIQDTIVTDLFNQDQRSFFDKINKNTWVHYWDDSCEGNISQNTAHYLSKKISIMGPTAAIFGREFEVFINEEYRLSACPMDKIEESINGSKGTLSKNSFEEAWPQNWHRQSYSSSSWK